MLFRWAIQMLSRHLDFWLFFLDILILLGLCVVWLPLVVIIALAVFLFDGPPIFFEQRRVGFNSSDFILYKFRTMANDLGKDERERITKFGRWLRRTGLDELPQVFNIFRGEMSFVGPRPWLSQDRIGQLGRYAQRVSVKPGVTGLAQVLYRGKRRSAHRRNRLDLVWVEKRSVGLYLKILFMTAPCLIRRFRYNKTGESL